MRRKHRFLTLLLAAGLVISTFSGQILAQGDKVELTLRLLPGHYYTKIVPGENKTLYLEIENTGDSSITNIWLSSDKPEGWVVDFEPESIDYLGAGSNQAIDVNVVAARDTDKGEHTLTFIAEADQTRTVTSTVLRIESTFTLWLWVGLGVVVLTIAGFILLYRRFGRD